MKLSTQPYKGARDFYPADKQLQNYIFSVWTKTALSFGYEQYDAPIIEPVELYLSKTSDEIVNEQTYSFEDRGGRKVTLRPEMTPTVSRMVAAKRQELGYPLRLFSMPNVWRYERPQKGRLREHWQLNVDIFGVESLAAEHEIILLANQIMINFGAGPSSYKIRLNSRDLVNYILADYLKIDQALIEQVVRLVDKKDKMALPAFDDSLTQLLGNNQTTVTRLIEILNTNNLTDLPTEVKNQPAALKLANLTKMLESSGVASLVFDPALMRGFDYYTDIVFEIFDVSLENNRSLFGGGRYDGLVGSFGVEPLATVGFGMGDVTILDFLTTHQLLPQLPSLVDVCVVIVGDEQLYSEAFATIRQLRESGLNVAVDFSSRKVDKKISVAQKKDYQKLIFIGREELTSEQYKLKDLSSGQEQTLNLSELIAVLHQQ